ncbi:MAG TPA: Lrp/AsnC ligand binding domain-containing protein [Actinomycetota bacterium]|jgi:hypothetical protein
MPSEEPAINAYVFMHLFEPGAPREGFNKIEDVLDQFRSKTGVRWAHHFVGSFIAFGAVDADSLEDLQARIAGEFWDAGVRSEWSLATRPSLYGAPHRGSPPFHALIRVRTKRRNPDDVLDDLDAAFAPIVDPLIGEYGEDGWRDHFYYAAATVSGKGFDILVELAAASMEDLTKLIFERIRPIEGVSSTDSSFAFIPE